MGKAFSVCSTVSNVRVMASTVSSARRVMIHHKCCNHVYPNSPDAERSPVKANQVPWDVPFPDYSPVDYTHKVVLAGPVWADYDVKDSGFSDIKWNTIDGKVNRESHMGDYEIVDGRPRNPIGRTGMTGRGLLGKWGPNHAADPIVTRWKRKLNGAISCDANGIAILQFVTIQRADSGAWALPGGMVDHGEKVSVTLKREFGEEALNSLEATDDEKKELEASVAVLFSKGSQIYRGYVDDPRNTDNAWMETVAVNFHDEDGKSVGRVKLNAGDDAAAVKWMDLSASLDLYASHCQMIQEVARKHSASW